MNPVGLHSPHVGSDEVVDLASGLAGLLCRQVDGKAKHLDVGGRVRSFGSTVLGVGVGNHGRIPCPLRLDDRGSELFTIDAWHGRETYQPACGRVDGEGRATR